MLLEFRMKNYKSFKDECVFSMRVAPKQKGLDYSILTEKIGRNDHKALSSAVIYGPNASGKTNIIGAMETFKEIVLRGNIRNTEVKNSPNAASSVLELIPNNTLDTAEPVDFSVIFTDHDLLFDYSISLDLGRFLSGICGRCSWRLFVSMMPSSFPVVMQLFRSGTWGLSDPTWFLHMSRTRKVRPPWPKAASITRSCFLPTDSRPCSAQNWPR